MASGVHPLAVSIFG
ncbi:Protein of unknown function [Bacillus wiedmannii]|uniref:Uncharacterized protein n=1 Tax=Bacillus wiedmannii TaxID=1890302 RepID=A0AB37YQW2_9BACI|nr:Protein of unknown function [Bacillus wiedmannii]